MLTITIISILTLCAISDVLYYRIPNYLCAILFSGIILSSLTGYYNLDIRDILISFLLFYPPLFFLWWSNKPNDLVIQNKNLGLSEINDSAKDNGSNILSTIGEYLFQVFIPSPVSWLISLIVFYLIANNLFMIPLIEVGLVFIICFIFKNKKCWMGGGDLKMLSCCFAIFGISGFYDFIINLSVCNVLLVLTIVSYRSYRKKNGYIYETVSHYRRVPMGVSIAVAGIISLLMRLAF